MRRFIPLLSVIALASCGKEPAGTSLTVFCAAGLKQPVEQIAAAFEKETGTAVRLQFGGTSTALTQFPGAKQGERRCKQSVAAEELTGGGRER